MIPDLPVGFQLEKAAGAAQGAAAEDAWGGFSTPPSQPCSGMDPAHPTCSSFPMDQEKLGGGEFVIKSGELLLKVENS